MVDARTAAVFVHNRGQDGFTDVTERVASISRRDRTTVVNFTGGKSYTYSTDRVRVAKASARTSFSPESMVLIAAQAWSNVVDLRFFRGPGIETVHVFYRAEGEERFCVREVTQVEVVRDIRAAARPKAILAAWSDVVQRLNPDDPIRWPFGALTKVRSDSALARYLEGAPLEPLADPVPAIFPFDSNLSQRSAVISSLGHPVSVIEGPPGTGKTQTILNIVASLVASDRSVGVISYNNTAVDNVREKLEAEGLGFVVAALGSQDRVARFLTTQERRIDELEHWLAAPRSTPGLSANEFEALERHLRSAQDLERDAAWLSSLLSSYQLERQHFQAHLSGEELPDLMRLPLLAKSSRKLLDYLAETTLEPSLRGFVGALKRIRRYLVYGSTKDVDPQDVRTILQLQAAYYEARIDEISRQLVEVQRRLDRCDLDGLLRRHRAASRAALDEALGHHYHRIPRKTYDSRFWREEAFWSDFPVVLSTCHSLGRNLGKGRLLDVLIIDEASQVNLLAAAVALACARQVIIVGDLLQLPHIADPRAADVPCPDKAYDYTRHNLLSSVIEVFGESVPRTMLREHYRCAPTIIDFCNRKFYDGALIPLTRGTPEPAMQVWASTPGHHMRRHDGGGLSNEREIDMIEQEVIPSLNLIGETIGIATPYRQQVNKLVGRLVGAADVDTIHRYQGRERDVMVMTTVLDDSWRGRLGVAFVDDPHLINVAVSRAKKKFVLVIHHGLMPTSRNIQDLIKYIRYQNLDAKVVQSEIISIFDLLYRDFSERLGPMSRRLLSESKYRSENIAATLVADLLAEEEFAGLRAAPQVLLRNVFPELERLTPSERSYVQHRASFDFVIHNEVTLQPLLAVEVDGFAYHENNAEQSRRDRLKDSICATLGLDLLRLPTTGSGEEQQLRAHLRRAWPGA